ncbi:MAG: hypothetical protein QME60_05445, partial [Verrucomicrobiota bacterium]|nr:hypothetical protein [Verrucomicrobiota bacterium]
MARKSKSAEDVLADADTREAMAGFEKEIANQERIVYGMALLFEGIGALCRDSPELVETYQAQFRNIIQTSQAGRVGRGACAPPPLTEPDL